MRKLVIGMAMASTALSTPALAREGQWYIQGDGGVMIVEDQSLDVNGAAGDAGADDGDAAHRAPRVRISGSVRCGAANDRARTPGWV